MKGGGGTRRVGNEIREDKYGQINKKGKPNKDQKMCDDSVKERENYVKLSRPITPGQKR